MITTSFLSKIHIDNLIETNNYVKVYENVLMKMSTVMQNNLW